MNPSKQIRAWKDPQFRASLPAAEQAELASPAGVIELSDDQLLNVGGGTTSIPCALTGPISVTVTFCSPTGSLCGTCTFGTVGCC